MARITVRTTIDAPPDVVWRHLEDITTHTKWMADAVAIRFTSTRTEGVGTTFDCDTKVGPLRMTDRMEVTRWDPGRAMGVRHVGIVTGTGEFTLRERRGRARGTTRFQWRESLTFPWWMGGPVGAFFGARVLSLIWRGNLRRLRQVVERG